MTKRPTSQGRRQTFIDAYLGPARGNATAAASLAGYRCPRQAGSRLLSDVDIRRVLAERATEAAMKADEVLARLSEIATADMRDFLDVQPDGSPRLDLAKAEEAGILWLIRRVRHRRRTTVRDGVTTVEESFSLELLDKLQALALLFRFHGLGDHRLRGPANTVADVERRIDIPGLADEIEGARAWPVDEWKIRSNRSA